MPLYEIPLDPQAISNRLETQQSRFVQPGPHRASGYPHDLRCSDGGARKKTIRRHGLNLENVVADEPEAVKAKYIYIMHVITGRETQTADALRFMLDRHCIDATILLPRDSAATDRHRSRGWAQKTTHEAPLRYPGCLFIGLSHPLSGDDVFAIQSLRIGCLDAKPVTLHVRNMLLRCIRSQVSATIS